MSDSWTGFTEFTVLKEKPPEGYTWSRERLTKRQATFRDDCFVARNLDKYVKELSAEGKAKLGGRKTEARECKKGMRYLLH